MTGVQVRIAELQEPMLKRRLYVVFATPEVSMEEMVRLLPDHLEYMIELEKTGVLFASGPFLAEDGTVPGSGMTILRAASREEAESLAERDPFYEAGMRSFEIKAWQLNEGSFSVRIDYSDGTYAVE